MKAKQLAKRAEHPDAQPVGQRYIWTAEWQGERKASADTKAGRVKAFNDADELIEDLHRKRR